MTKRAPTSRKSCATALATAAVAAAAVLATSAHAQDGMDSMEGGMRMGAVVRYDPAVFRTTILPLLELECSGCHDAGDPNNTSRHRIVLPSPDGTWSEEAVEANYKGTVALLYPAAPERSLLLSKLAPLTRGGIAHDGGKADGTEFAEELLAPDGPLVSWIFGATQDQKPPIAVLAPWPTTLPVGAELPLDASLSYDPDGDEVAITWQIVEKPLRAEARLTAATGAKTQLTPDRAGPYVLRCDIKAGELTGWPIYVRVDATRVADRPITAGDGPGPLTRVPSEERRLTRRLYFDLFGRSPLEEELRETAALPYPKRVDALLDSAEAWQHWFDEESFYFLLIDQFRPVSDRLAKVPERMREGTLTFRDAHLEFALSAEFNTRNPGNDTYVSVVLEQFLGIEVQKETRLLEAAKKMYDGEKTRIWNTLGHNQSDMVKLTLDQPGYLDMFVTRMATRYRGAPLDKDAHATAVGRLALDPSEWKPLLREWLTSPDYTRADRPPVAKDDHQFIRGLFVDLLGRPPALQEFRNMRNALQALTDPAPVRGVLAKVMLDSGAVVPPDGLVAPPAAAATGGPGAAGGSSTSTTSDGSGRAAAAAVSADAITSLFNRLLGRDPSEAEMRAFVDVLSDPGATWRTAALALLSSGQYQYY